MSLRRTVSCAVALGIAAVPVSIAPALGAPTFPATASATLVGLVVAPDAGGAEGLWGTVYVSSEVGEERLGADTSGDQGGLLEPVSVVGPAQATVNTTARGEGRAEAIAELGGLTLSLPGTDTPAVEVGPLSNSLTCDFSGNLEWESGPEPERVVTVFGTAITPSGGEATADVELPDGSTAEVTVTDHTPAEGDTGAGEMYTAVTATVDGTELLDLTMAAVSVECPADGGTGDAPAAGEQGDREPTDGASPREDASPDPGAEAPATDGPDESDPDEGADPAAQSPTPTSAPAADDGDGGPGGLPVTGAALAGLVTAGVLAVGGGAAAVYLARRRSRGHDDTPGPEGPAV
ncbi:hypothetical protein [Nocardiopsis sp. CC223A]|uniref:hypothetical protein n=1 Tax=Nocardiopsis sp. CC223A TaxID=3044051 RepID=UPI00278C7083|nr:hypothetical protein [Nocardiopsis sp. CC223A]